MKFRKTLNRNSAAEITADLMLAMGIIVTLFMMACGAPDGNPQTEAAPTVADEAKARVIPATNSCLDAEPPSPRPLDPAAHVYDQAVHSYLAAHASSIGREPQGDEARKALAVTDDTVYRICVQGPENCLRDQFARAEDKPETLGLLTTKGAYAYDRALQCLIREGENYQGEGQPNLYDQQVAVHLVGAVMPVGTLRETDYYGDADPERLQAAEANWNRCYDLIAGSPVDADGIADKVDADLLTTIDCGDGETNKPSERGDESTGD